MARRLAALRRRGFGRFRSPLPVEPAGQYLAIIAASRWQTAALPGTSTNNDSSTPHSVAGCCDHSGMFQGRLIAESCKPEIDIQVSNLRLVRIGRHDVTQSKTPADERDQSPTPAATGQPAIWTFVDFEGPNEIADDLARAFVNALQPELGWWADFTIDDTERVIVSAGKVFGYRMGDQAASAEAKAWGRWSGCGEYRVSDRFAL